MRKVPMIASCYAEHTNDIKQYHKTNSPPANPNPDEKDWSKMEPKKDGPSKAKNEWRMHPLSRGLIQLSDVSHTPPLGCTKQTNAKSIPFVRR